MGPRRLLSALVILTAAPVAAQPPQPPPAPPSYVRQVKPFLARYCVECHSPSRARGDLDLSTVKAASAGGQNGPSLVPGKPDESLVVLLTEHKDNPPMPPKGKPQPTPAETALLRAWVAAGARDDTGTVTLSLPDLKPRQERPAPVTALAYRGLRPLAAGGHGEVTLLDPADGRLLGKLTGLTGPVTALAFSPDGNTLAVAAGQAGTPGQVRLYFVPPSGLPVNKPEAAFPAHADAVQALAFSPDGKLLATAGYDRLVKLWDAATGREVRALRDHSDSVYALAFSPDGKLLATGAADRTVKLWEVASGRCLSTLAESTDWVYAVAWHPGGRRLAAAGVDRSVRVWELAPGDGQGGGKVVLSAFAHEAPVTRLTFSADGATLYSLGEDRVVKAWSADRLQERQVYPRAAEAVLALAVRGDGRQLALGRHDGVLTLLDAAEGKVTAEPLPVKPAPPKLDRVSPAFGPRGGRVRVALEGDHLDAATEIMASVPGVAVRLLPEGHTAKSVAAELSLPATLPAGPVGLSVRTPGGTAGPVAFTVDLFPAVEEVEPNDSAAVAPKVTLPVTLTGTLGRAGDVDYVRFEAAAGQEVGAQAVAVAPPGGKPAWEPVLVLTDAAGRTVAQGPAGILGAVCPAAGTYALGVRDREFRGGPSFAYRLHAGTVPVVTGVFPAGLQRGTEAEVHLDGVHLGPARTVRVRAPADAAPGSTVPVPATSPHGSPLGVPALVVGEFPEVGRPSEPLPVPGTANGRLDRPGAADVWRFPARKGQRLLLEVHARRLGSPVDSYIEVLDAAGRPVPRAVLRSVARTYTTFRDHDAAGPGIRLEHWSEFAVNDLCLLGSEVARIRELPKNPDDDCQFYSTAGQRQGQLDTTPTHHPLAEPMYRVTVHPPGTTFSPNGFPVATLPYRNDDGGPGFGKDSRLTFDPPADGDYQVRITDARGGGGPAFVYRLTVRPPRPSFQVRLEPAVPAVPRGGAAPVTVSIERSDGFDGSVDVRLEGVPAGFTAPPTNILPADVSTVVGLAATAAAAAPPATVPPLKVVARAVIDGREVVREAVGGRPTLADPGDIVTRTGQGEVSIRPGGQARLTVQVERKNGFAGRIPVDVRGLPHGVRVLDVGLNGILITEKETAREVVLYAEPWMEAAVHPFVVVARREGKGTEHAAPSVMLRVAK